MWKKIPKLTADRLIQFVELTILYIILPAAGCLVITRLAGSHLKNPKECFYPFRALPVLGN